MNDLAESCPDWVAEANAHLCRCRRRAGHAVALRVLGGTLEDVSTARDFVRALLCGNPLRDDAVSVVSELVANAVRHSRSGAPGGTVLLSVRLSGASIRVAVTDEGGGAEPWSDFETGGQLVESGMGLALVRALSVDSGWCGDDSGRTVWAVLASPRL